LTGIKLHKEIILITAFLFAMGGHSVFAQTSINQVSYAKDTAVAIKKEHNFFAFFTRLFHKPVKRLKDTSATARKKAKANDTTATAKKPHKKEFDLTKGGVSYTSLYTQGINLNTGINGLYSLTHVFQNFDAFGLPLQAQGTAVFNNGTYESAYSTYSVNFDEQTYLERLRKRAMDQLVNKEANMRDGLTKQHLNLSDSMQTFESTRQKLTSPSYQADIWQCRDMEKKEQDSLNKNPNMDTTKLHSLRTKIAAAEQLEKRYNQLFAIKKNYSSLATRNDTAITNNEARFDKDKAALDNPQSVVKDLENNKMLSKYEKFLMGFQKLSFGNNMEEISQLTLHSFMFKGADVAYKAGDVYVAGGYGNEQAIIDPYLMSGVNIPEIKRTVEYARAGLGSEQSNNIYLTAIRITDAGSPSSLGENNTIIDISKRIVCTKNLYIEGEIAQSFFKYLPNKSDTAPLPSLSGKDMNLAYSLRLHGILPYLKTTVKAEYSDVGAGYITLGNPYLLTGSHIYRAELMQPINKKLKIGIGGEHTEQSLLNSPNEKQTDNWLDFSIDYKPANNIVMQAKYSPREFQQQEGTIIANNYASNMNQMSFMTNISSRMFGRDENTIVFIGNFQYSTPQSAIFLQQSTTLTYYMLNEIFSVSPSSGITLTANESRNGWTGNLSQLISEAMYNKMTAKSFTISGGMQWVEQPSIMPNEMGLIGSIGKTFKKWGKFSLMLNGRNNIDRPFYMNSAQFIVSANASIFW
jgi:hypothetical protein